MSAASRVTLSVILFDVFDRRDFVVIALGGVSTSNTSRDSHIIRSVRFGVRFNIMTFEEVLKAHGAKYVDPR